MYAGDEIQKIHFLKWIFLLSSWKDVIVLNKYNTIVKFLCFSVNNILILSKTKDFIWSNDRTKRTHTSTSVMAYLGGSDKNIFFSFR